MYRLPALSFALKRDTIYYRKNCVYGGESNADFTGIISGTGL